MSFENYVALGLKTLKQIGKKPESFYSIEGSLIEEEYVADDRETEGFIGVNKQFLIGNRNIEI